MLLAAVAVPGSAQQQVNYPYVGTVTGGPHPGFVDGRRGSGMLNGPIDLVFGGDGALYVLDMGNCAIRKVAMDGAITTLTGGRPGLQDGPAGVARFGWPGEGGPRGLACGPDGALYVADTPNNAIRKVGLDGTVSTLTGAAWDATGTRLLRLRGHMDGAAGRAQFRSPYDLAFHRGQWPLYVADADNQAIRTVSADGSVSTLTGAVWDTGMSAWVAWSLGAFLDGRPGVARFSGPTRICVGPDELIYVGDQDWKVLRKVWPGGDVRTWIGAWWGGARWFPVGKHTDGPPGVGGFAGLGGPVFAEGNAMYIADWRSHTIRKAEPDGTLSTIAGGVHAPGFRDGPARLARFREPAALALRSDGTLYVADAGSHSIRRISLRPLAGTGPQAGTPPIVTQESKIRRFTVPK